MLSLNGVPMSNTFCIPSISQFGECQVNSIQLDDCAKTTPIYFSDCVVYESSTTATPAACQPAPKAKKCRHKKEAPMGRYYDECEDRYVDAIPSQSDLATAREYLTSRIQNVQYEKSSGDLRKAFYLDDDQAPATAKEALERIAAGKFVAPTEEQEKVMKEQYGYRWYSHLTWRDPSKPADRDGYRKAVEALEEAATEARDVIKTGTEKEGLEALKAFQAQTFH